MCFYFVIETLVVFRVLEVSYGISVFSLCCILLFILPFGGIVYEVFNQQKVTFLKKKSLEEVLNTSCLVSKTDKFGKIIEVNEKFCEVSGYSRQELLGRDHKILNSGYHPKSFWVDMYKTTAKYKSIWQDIVVNKTKEGKKYYVKSWIVADFDSNDNLIGFTSVRQDITNLMETLSEIDKKNSYLEHAAKILRHDMHSGINTYIPRGISGLKRRLKEEIIIENRLSVPLKLIEEGLLHTQKVYKGVLEFTNLVREDAELSKSLCNIYEILENYLSTTSYSDQVILDKNLPNLLVNEALFCTAIDNLIRNGLKYNDSDTKFVEIKLLNEETIAIIDNGRGMSQEEFKKLSKPYSRRKDQKESGTGLGLNITVAILKEHDFNITSERRDPSGTIIKVKIK